MHKNNIPVRTGKLIMIHVPYIKFRGPPKKKIINIPTASNNIPAICSRFHEIKRIINKAKVNTLCIKNAKTVSQNECPSENTSKEKSMKNKLTNIKNILSPHVMYLFPLTIFVWLSGIMS